MVVTYLATSLLGFGAALGHKSVEVLEVVRKKYCSSPKDFLKRLEQREEILESI